jgi:hypothetical protein
MAIGLKQFNGKEGLAPYGLRNSGDGVKGKGYFGELPTKSGRTATEISAENNEGEYPLIVPTLTKKELDHLLADKKPTNEIYDKAESWANERKKNGKSPFAEPTELRMPTPQKKGGLIKTASSRGDGIANRGKTKGKIV